MGTLGDPLAGYYNRAEEQMNSLLGCRQEQMAAKPIAKSAADTVADHLEKVMGMIIDLEKRYGDKFQEFMFPDEPRTIAEAVPCAPMPSYFIHLEGKIRTIEDAIYRINDMISRTGI
jgi:hypothetical protein